MPIVDVQRGVKASLGLVWKVVSDLSGEPANAPFLKCVDVLEGEALGLRRRMSDSNGYSWEEQCVRWEPERLYTIEVATRGSPLRLGSVRYTCSVEADGNMVNVRLFLEYTTRYGPLGKLLERMGERRKLKSFATKMLDNWMRIVHSREWAYRMTAKTIIDEKGGNIHSIAPETPIRNIVETLRKHRIGSLLVMNPSGELAGVLSERDVIRGLAEQGPAILDQPASSLMTADVVVIQPDDNMMSIMSCMSERRVRHLPVVQGEKVLGMVSIGDVIKARMVELEGQSETMRDYIEARRWHELYKEVGPAAYAEE